MAKKKQKDFQKQKLRVGKTKPKAANNTDTSFRAKAISLPKQSILLTKSSESELLHNVSLTKHNTPQIRKEAVLFFEKHLTDHPNMMKNVILAVAKLIIDTSKMVRAETVILFEKMPLQSVQLNFKSIILYVQSAMTHINAAIRNDSTKFVRILVQLGCLEVLVNSCWVKFLQCYFSLMGWKLKSGLNNKAVLNDALENAALSDKVRHLEVLLSVLEYGTKTDSAPETLSAEFHATTDKYLLPTSPGAFVHLQLFKKSSLDTNDVICEDVPNRRRVFVETFAESATKELHELVKDGGEVGRVAAKTLKRVQAIVEEENGYKESLGLS